MGIQRNSSGKEKSKRWKRVAEWAGLNLSWKKQTQVLVEYTIHAQTPVTTSRSSLLCPSCVMQTEHRSHPSGEARGPFSPSRGILQIPIGIPKMQGISNNQVSIPIPASFIRPEFCFYLPRKRSRGGRSGGAKDIRVDFTAASGQRRYFTPLKRGNSR